jgi:type VI secretion system secreted protein Hcp
MPIPSYMTLTGKKQGKIEGSCEQKGHEGAVLIEEFHHEVSLPFDPQSGQPSGQRVHKPLEICKYFDKASPKLYKALSTGERFSELEIKWYRINPNGEEQHYFTHKLEDAVIVGIYPYMHNCLDKITEQYGHMERVCFTYRKIQWTWVDGGVAAEDDWKERPIA